MRLIGLFTLVVKLAMGTYAIHAPRLHLSIVKSIAYAVAAAYHGTRAGVDPFELIAVARNESDFDERCLSADRKDCGLLQTRVTITKYSCRALRRSYWLAFQEAARELKENSRSCRRHDDYARCRLNRYNSGVRYARHGAPGRYWLRVQCFNAAARRGLEVGDGCRAVKGKRDIVRVLRQAERRRDLLASPAHKRVIVAAG
jgi:hypothetical protein